MIGWMLNMTRGGRLPYFSARFLTSSTYSFMPLVEFWLLRMHSAWRAANSRPRPEPPAWKITGETCGEEHIGSGPRDWYHLPLKLTSWTLAGWANWPRSRSSSPASGSHLLHR